MKNNTHRRGTALIIVIAILIMLAIMATAYISVARIDRQSVTNTGGSNMISQDDPLDIKTTLPLLMNTLNSAIKNRLVQDVYSGVYRSPNDSNFRYDYDTIGAIDSSGVDGLVSDRLPVPASASTTEIPAWASAAAPLGGMGDSMTEYDAPGAATNIAAKKVTPATVAEPTSVRVTYSDNITSIPESLRPKLEGRARIYPAFILRPDAASSDSPELVIAADADGDGVPDSIFQKITSGTFSEQTYPGGENRKVTYWVAYRVVDNGSAINVNTALDNRGDPVINSTSFRIDNDITQSFDPTGTARVNMGYFRSNIGLRQLLWISAGDPTIAGTVITADPDSDAMQKQLTKLLDWRTNEMFSNSASAYRALKSDGDPFTNFRFTTLGEMMDFQLGRRLKSPEYAGRKDDSDDSTAVKARSLRSDDSASLAYGFVFRPPGSTITNTESIFDRHLLKWAPNYAGKDSSNVLPYYPADQARLWWQWNFNPDNSPSNGREAKIADAGTTDIQEYVSSEGPAYYSANPPATEVPRSDSFRMPGENRTGDAIPLRSMLTTYNPVSSFSPNAGVALKALTDSTDLTNNVKAADDDFMPTEASLPWVRTSVNTGTFGQIWRAYFAVMAGASGGLPSTNSGHDDDSRSNIFHSVLRKDPAVSTPPVLGDQDKDMLVLRSAIAAVNTIDLRDHSSDRPTVKTITLTSPSGGITRKARVYGNKPQVYFTEVLVATGGTAPNSDLVVIELFNPNADPITLNGWKLATRDASGLTEVGPTSLDTVTIPAGQYFILTNDSGGSLLQNYVINLTLTISPQTYLSVPTLTDALGKELILVRPSSDGSTELTHMAPVDQYDFKAVKTTSTGNTAGLPRWYHYARSTKDIWDCVYPGQWRPLTEVAGEYVIDANDQQHVDADPEPATDDTAPNSPITEIGGENLPADVSFAQTYFIPVNLKGWPGPNPGKTPLLFPFGGFARDGDILKVPFIGAYTIYDFVTTAGEPDASQPLALVEINGLPMDSQFATITGSTDQYVGRFWPTDKRDAASAYRFTHKLFDYLTAHDSPEMDYLPDVTSTLYPGREEIDNGETAKSEAGVQGKININTAPWQVLATLPLVMKADGTVDYDAIDASTHPVNNITLAKAIVKHREDNGPFKSIFDLKDVSGFNDPNTLISTQVNSLYAYGDNRATSIADTANKPTKLDKDTIQLVRLSNLITTRSDSFTVYLLVQAWLNADDGQPLLLDERRMSYIVDRSILGDKKTDVTDLKVISVSTQ